MLNISEKNLGKTSSLVELLCYRAQCQPDKTGYIFLNDGESDEARLTYQELDQQARSIAARLSSLGAPGERVLLLYQPGLEYISSFFGCLYAGVTAVPVYPPHPARLERTLPRLKNIAKDAGPFAVLTSSSILPMAEPFLSGDPDFGNAKWLSTDDIPADEASCWQQPSFTKDSLAFLQYTSGSTGIPKGVMVSHENLLFNLDLIHACFDNTSDSFGVIWLPPYHDMGLIGGILQPLYGGFPVVLMSPVHFLQKPFRWLNAISKYKASVSGGPNFAYDLCGRKITPDQLQKIDLSSWEVAFNGAEPIRPNTMKQFSEAFSHCGFRREAFYPCYGLAEGTLIVSGGLKNEAPVLKNFSGDALAEKRALPSTGEADDVHTLVGCGKNLPGQQIAIVEPYTFSPCEPDEIGEIWVLGKSVARGYWQNSEETEDAFQAYMTDTGQGPFLRTGDLGFVSDDELFVTGRLKDIIIIRGRNYYPHDIEMTAEKSYPRLRPGCSAVFEVEINGEKRVVVTAEIEHQQKNRRKKSPDESGYKGKERSHRSDRQQHTELPCYDNLENKEPADAEKAVKAIRRAISEEHELEVYAVLILKIGGIPKTSSGKIQRYACKKGFLNKTLDIVASSIQENIEYSGEEISLDMDALLTTSPEQRQILLESYFHNLVSSVMKIHPSNLEISQPLNSLGIDSVMAIELQHRLETDLGTELSMTKFLDGTNIARLSEDVAEKLAIGKRKTENQVSSFKFQVSPLSYNQKSLWFMYQLAPESTAYNVFFAVCIRSDIDIPSLHSAFQTLVTRHPSLRTVYTVRDGEPVQQIADSAEVHFEVKDASAWSGDELNTYLTEESHHSFDLENGPVFRVNLFTCSTNNHILLLNIHHIAIDLWSFSLMLDELRILYPKFLQSSELSEAFTDVLPLPPLFYSDYVRWQDQMLSGPEGDRLWNYWRNQLGGVLPVLNLPTDHPRPPVQTYNGASYSFRLDEELTRKIKKQAQAENVTLYMILLATFQVLLYRYTKQEDILVGSPVAGRSRPEFKELMGYFVNPVVMRAEMFGHMTFRGFLGQVRQTVLDALEHQDYPFQLLVERLQPKRESSRSPLFQVMFVLQKPYRLKASAPFAARQAGARMNLRGLELESVALEQGVSQFDLTLVMAETGRGISASLEYNTDLFDMPAIEWMVEHFRSLMKGIVANPDCPVAELPLMTETELHMLLVEFNNTTADYPSEKTVVDLFEEKVEKNPGKTAVVFEDTYLSYEELNTRANQVAHFLKDKYNIQPDDRVVLLLERSEWVIIGIMGILKAGGAYVPIDPGYPEERIKHMVSDSGCKVVLSETGIVKIPGLQTEVVNIHEIRHENYDNPDCPASPDNLAYVIYTSGSTGIPKGIMIEHRSVVNLICGDWQALYGSIGEGMHQALTASFVFDVSVAQIFISLIFGNTLYVVTDETLHNPELFINFLQKKNIHIIDVSPGFLLSVVESKAAGKFPENIRHINLGAEKLAPSLIEKFYEHDEYKKITLCNFYGPTENCADSLWFPIDSDFQPFHTVPIGKPLPNIQVFILDAFLNPVSVGVPGEICLSGAGLARGYLNRPDLTAEKFINWKSETGNQKSEIRLYRTGDLGRWLPEGNIEFMGRNDDQVKIRGYRVELGEIENHLLSHKSTSGASVIAKEFRKDYTELAAYMTGDENLNIGELRNHLRTTLPDYMIPSYFIQLDKLPLTTGGKVDRRRLPEPETGRPQMETAYVTPETDIEQSIAGVWQELLKLEKVGIHDNFFDMGGHSLLIIRVQNKLQQIFNRDIPAVDLFRYPTISTLARYLEQEQPAFHQVYDRSETREAVKTSRERRRASRLKHRNN